MMRRKFLQQIAGSVAALSAAVAEQARAQDGKRFRIYAVTWRGKTQVESGFEDFLGKRGLTVDFIWRDAEQKVARLAEYVREIKTLKPDLVYTWGTPPTLGIAGPFDAPDSSQYINDIPLIFAVVAAPVAARIVPALTDRRREITGVTHVAAMEAQLEAMRTYRPFARLGVLYNAAELNSKATAESLRRLAVTQKFELVEQTFTRDEKGAATATGIEEKVAALKQAGAEWLYLGPDSYLFTQIERVAAAALALRLPTFSATEAALGLRAPVLTGLVANYYTIGQFAGHKAEQILVKGIRAHDVPIETLSRYSFIVRMDVAKQLDILPPVSLFNYAIMR
ncbi:MAG: ABC transporter substrate binding protein [Usitatibacteraceae bacterium]